MTCKELYEQVKNTMFDKPSSKYFDAYYLTWINTMIFELFNTNNALRLKNGKDELIEVPVVTQGNDEIVFEQELIHKCMKYGLARNFYTDDDNLAKWDLYNSLYMNGRQSCTVARLVTRGTSNV